MEELVPTPSTIEFIKQRYRYTPEEIEVTVQFDAQNIYGAKIRHKLKCTYLERKKGVVKASKIELDHETLSELGLAVTNTAIYLKHRYEFD